MSQESFETVATGAGRGVMGELYGFMKDNAKWWLTPFFVVFALLGVLLMLGATGAAPFIYSIF